jgi:hypothetical protein
MNQNSRFPLPPNIQQQISNNQNFHSMQNFNHNHTQPQQFIQQQSFNQMKQQQQILYHRSIQQHNDQLQSQQPISQPNQLNNELSSNVIVENDDFPKDDDDLILDYHNVNQTLINDTANMKNGTKRSYIQHEEEDIETTVLPVKTTTILSANPEENVAPIIYFRINFELVKNPLLLEKTIMEALKHTNITLKAIKITKNGNLLVYPCTNSDKKKIIDCQLLFNECKFFDLETNKKIYQLMVKGINAENLELRYNSSLSVSYKLDKIIEIKRRDGTVLNLCKIERIQKKIMIDC